MRCDVARCVVWRVAIRDVARCQVRVATRYVDVLLYIATLRVSELCGVAIYGVSRRVDYWRVVSWCVALR